jgi:polyphosphate kinase
MRRNLSHRVEILFPVGTPRLVRRVKEILDVQLADERKAHHLRSDGHYARSSKRGNQDAVDSQGTFLANEREPLKVAKGLSVSSRKRRATERRSQVRSEA